LKEIALEVAGTANNPNNLKITEKSGEDGTVSEI